jgi:exopolysaccharide biosynthesis protein
MKKLLSPACAILCLILFCLTVSAQDFQTVTNGVEHAKIIRPKKSANGKDENAVINLLRLDLTKVRLDVVHALDAAIGLEKTSSIAQRYGAIAAINAGFFRIDKSIWEGDDVGLLQINGRLLSENNNQRVALLISQRKDRSRVKIEKLGGNFMIFPRKLSLKISGINRERKADELIMYTPEFHRTTLTNNSGTEFVIKNDKIVQIINGRGSNPIPADAVVFSASGKYKEELKFLKVGDKFPTYLYVHCVSESSKNTDDCRVIDDEDIISGVPQLIEKGKINVTWQEEKSSKDFVETHHPRTAVAKLKDGKFLMVTVDGRSEESGGMSLYQLAEFLLEQGAVDAMNLDGGGSTTMVLGGAIINKPSDKEGERKVGDAILVFPR